MVSVVGMQKLVVGDLRVDLIPALDTIQSPGFWLCLENDYMMLKYAIRWKLSTGMQIIVFMQDLIGLFVNNHWYTS